MDDGPVRLDFDTAMPVGDGMRDENGTLVGGLYAVDYERGMADFKDGRPRPEITTPSYDLGRAKASDDAALTKDVLDGLAARPACPPEPIRTPAWPSENQPFRDPRQGNLSLTEAPC